MLWCNSDPHLTASEVGDFFDEIPEETINIFTYQKRDGNLLGIKDFFKAFYHKRISRFRKSEIDTAKAQFHLIFSDNVFMIEKIKKEMEIFRELANIDKNWKYVTKSEVDLDFKTDNTTNTSMEDTNTNTKDLISGSLKGLVDASQFAEVKKDNMLTASDQKIMGYLDPNARTREHVITRDSGTDTFRMTALHKIDNTVATKNTGHTTVSASNTSEDYKNFINLTLPEMRKDFLEKFGIMFFM